MYKRQAVYSYSIKIGHTPNTKEETKHQRMLRLLTEMTQKDGQYKDMKDLFKVLLGLRVRADYEGDDVRLQELERNYNSAKSLKEHFIGLLYSK